MIGRFHEVSVHAPDLLASLAFYERLGFTQVTAGEAFAYPYAVVADGRLAIGLHGHELPAVAAALLRAARIARSASRRSSAAASRSSTGGSATTSSTRRAWRRPARPCACSRRARIHPPRSAPARPRASAGSRSTRCRSGDLKDAEAAFERLGFVPAEEGDEPYPHIGMTSDSLNVALLGAGLAEAPRARIHRRGDARADRDTRGSPASSSHAGLPAGLDADAARPPRRARGHATPADHERRMTSRDACRPAAARCTCRNGLGSLRRQGPQAARPAPARRARLPGCGARDRHRGHGRGRAHGAARRQRRLGERRARRAARLLRAGRGRGRAPLALRPGAAGRRTRGVPPANPGALHADRYGHDRRRRARQ